MFWGSLVFVIVSLLQINVLAAEVYMGNSRGWNSRDLNFRRPLQIDSRPNPVTQPIHSIPRPLPKPSETPHVVLVEPTTTSAVTEMIYENQQPEHNTGAAGRSMYRVGPQRFNLQRRPLLQNKPVPTARQPIAVAPPLAVVAPEPAVEAPKPVVVIPEPVPVAPQPTTIAPVEIANEPSAPIAVSPQKIPDSNPLPLEIPESSEDIEVITRTPPAATRSSLRHYLMPRPIPRPSTLHPISSSPQPAPQPEVIATPAPIRSVTIIKEEPEVIPEEETSTPKAELWPVSNPTEQPALIETSSPVAEFIPKLIPADIEEEPLLIEDEVEEEPEAIEIVTPAEKYTTLRPRPVTVPVPQPTTVIIEEVRPKAVSSSPPVRTMLRRRRPVTRKPTVAPVVTTTAPPRLIVKPAPPAPSVKPIPLVTPTKLPSNKGKSFVPVLRSTTEAPVQLMDYHCDQINAYYGVSNECDSYVECKSYVAMMSSCPDGLHFNPRALWPEYPCAYPSEVQCESNSIRQKAQPTDQCPRQHGFFPLSDSDCSRYMICQDGIGTVMNCPPGLVFNADMSTCDWPENVPSCNPSVFRGFTCPAPPLEEDGTPSDMIFKYRYNQSCKEYVACQRGHPRLLKCDPGLFFDEESGFCIDAEYVDNCLP